MEYYMEFVITAYLCCEIHRITVLRIKQFVWNNIKDVNKIQEEIFILV